MNNQLIMQQSKPEQEAADGSLRGHIDGFLDRRLRGWAFDASDSSRRINLLVFIDGKVAGACVADVFCADLKQAGFGTGEHAFAFEVPRELLDGETHRVDVVDPEKRLMLPGSPQAILLPAASKKQEGEIERLEWCNLVGWITEGTHPENPIDFVVTEGGRELARGTARERRPDDSFSFSVRLPEDVCDGRPHAFSLETHTRIAAIAVVTPFLLTPEEVLADFASTKLSGRLSNAATYRYQALVEQMERVAKLPASEAGVAARDYTVIHSYLVRGAKKKGLEDVYESFTFPEVDEPVASILVPVHNKSSYTYHCLASLRLMPNEVPFEVIVLDDWSSDETEKLEGTVSGVRVVRN